MDSLKYLNRIVYYLLAAVAILYISVSLDELFFEGQITELISTVESTIKIQYDDSILRLETSISCLHADSTHLSMHLKWII